MTPSRSARLGQTVLTYSFCSLALFPFPIIHSPNPPPYPRNRSAHPDLFLSFFLAVFFSSIPRKEKTRQPFNGILHSGLVVGKSGSLPAYSLTCKRPRRAYSNKSQPCLRACCCCLLLLPPPYRHSPKTTRTTTSFGFWAIRPFLTFSRPNSLRELSSPPSAT